MTSSTFPEKLPDNNPAGSINVANIHKNELQ